MNNIENLKLINDPLYSSMIKAGYSYSDLIQSGWINTKYSHEENLFNYNVFSTPLNKFINNNKNPVILLSTGSFAPSHFGHIEMMINAKNYLNLKNIIVDSIILSPSHDDYVLSKSNDIKTWNIEERIKELKKSINNYPYENKKDMDLFSIDIWESKYCNCPVNFSDVIYKIETNIKKINKVPDIYYVFGSDNLEFYKCFENTSKYHGICVERDGFLNPNKNIKNVFFIENHKFKNLKSREIRKNLIKNIDTNKKEEKDYIYIIREDSNIAVSNWTSLFPEKEEQLYSTYLSFHNQLSLLFNEFILSDVFCVNSYEQYKLLNNKLSNEKIINLDSCTNIYQNKNHFPLDFSRNFDFDFFQEKPYGLVYRYGEEITIPSDDYILVDDDISSGFTINQSTNFIEKNGSTIKKSISLLDLFLNENKISKKVHDVVDSRDFLLGSFCGGLVCNINNIKTRVPYFLPWINLSSRASIDTKHQKEFMIRILSLNLVFFEKNNFIGVEHIDKSLHNFLKLNYKFNTISDFISSHISWIEKNMH